MVSNFSVTMKIVRSSVVGIYMRLLWFFSIRVFLFAFFLIFSFSSFANKPCEGGFDGSRLHYDNKALEKREESKRWHSRFVDVFEEKALQKIWNEKPDLPVLLNALFPKDVHFIKRQLFQPDEATAVKMSEWGEALMVRAHYKHGDHIFHTNVVFSRRALLDNMNDGAKQKWLVGKNAKAAVLYLHGGGTKTTGSHVARVMVTHFRKYDIDVVSVDLPWHAQGHREFLDFETDIKVLGSFVQKYIPPNVPLFVGGHSWGSVFAEKLMTMTDRPTKDFLFHPNLKGVVILSTAVNPASGNYSMQEKYDVYSVKLSEARQRVKNEGPKHEQYIFENIVTNGKMSPLGGFYSLRSILELDQRVPDHEGRQYIPALMAVGTKDALVYLGFEKEYEYYKKLKNVETHYLDDPLPYMSAEGHPLRRVGHLIADYAAFPDTTKPVTYVLIEQFIAKQLALDSLKAGISRKVRSSSLNDADKALAIKELGEMRSFDEIRDFLETDTRIQNLNLESINYINDIFNIELQSSSTILRAEKSKQSEIPAFVNLVQLSANDLSFREFIREYRYQDQQKTSTYISYRQEKRQDNVQKISGVLSNYNSPIVRIGYLLNRLSNVNDLAGLESLHKEVKFIAEVVSKRVNNKRIESALIGLKEQIEKQISSGGGEGLHSVKEMAEQIVEENSSFFNNKSAKKGKTDPTAGGKNYSNKKLISGLVAVLLQSENLHQAKEIIRSEQLPESIGKEVTALMQKYFVIEDLIGFKYVPKKDDILKTKLSSKRKRKALAIIDQLYNVIKNKKKLDEEYNAVRKEKIDIKKDYIERLDEVRHNIKLFKETLERVEFQPPLSLRDAYEKGEKELKKVVKAVEKMDQILERMSAQVLDEVQVLSDSQIAEVFKEKRLLIDNVNNMYLQYIQSRQLLKQKVVVAGENGEMGEKFKNVVISLYGHGSDGKSSVVGPGNVYADLESIIRQLAVAEARMERISKLQIANYMEYNSLMNSLQRSISNGKKKQDTGISFFVREASNLFNVVEYPLNRVLNGEYGNIRLNGENGEGVMDYINSNNVRPVFVKAVERWEDLHSKVPPLLPTSE